MNRTSAPARWAAALALAASALTAAAVPAQADEQPRKQYPVGDVADGVRNFLFSPNAVTGVNDWNCRPSAAHPNPVVLVHGTGVNLGANWVKMGPTLANEGHCVYAFNYGMGSPFDLGGRVGGLTGVAKSAGTMSAFVDKVLAATGAQKVNVLGHSQGGMMPNYYIKRLGGAQKVDRLVALAPTNHGTTLSGLVNLGKALGVLGIVNGAFDHLNLQGLKDQQEGSDFQRALWADGDTVPGVRYTVIATKYDLIASPYRNGFLKGDHVRNIVVQDQCPKNPVGHVGLFTDGPTTQNVVNALGADKADFKPRCEGYGLPL
ncbi:esterase/lipase family protein [Streptomyces flavofungini]|uniref:Alpha/beta fold hydrolase n=1 Tax=Streptomyces flavofungini TaxID=68200 RepID=A0ABS0WXW7_9ACTN|nr:alpha/beta fold hydrolase [Streptomyces flavofungini]MBJ3805777.1 alpha/beta fold hydrolase [Streptomyces flavofungini]GHC71804.1 lipase [Streptomyces flavofungini]